MSRATKGKEWDVQQCWDRFCTKSGQTESTVWQLAGAWARLPSWRKSDSTLKEEKVLESKYLKTVWIGFIDICSDEKPTTIRVDSDIHWFGDYYWINCDIALLKILSLSHSILIFAHLLFPKGKLNLTCHPLIRLSVAIIWVTGKVQGVQGADAACSIWTWTQRQEWDTVRVLRDCTNT